MKVLLILPAAEHLRMTPGRAAVPRRSMLRFSLLPLTTVAALTPPEHRVEICDENVQPLNFDTDADLIGISFMTALAPEHMRSPPSSADAGRLWSPAVIIRRSALRRPPGISTPWS